MESVTDRLIASLDRIGANLIENQKNAIYAWAEATDKSLVENVVSIVEKDYPGGMAAGMAKKPIFSFLSGATPDFEKQIDAGVLAAINSLDTYLSTAAKQGGA